MTLYECLRDLLRADQPVALVTVVEGDPCPQCGAALAISRGIEVWTG